MASYKISNHTTSRHWLNAKWRIGIRLSQLLICRRQHKSWRGSRVTHLEKDCRFLLKFAHYVANKDRRLTVAQDGKEMYIIISEYSDSYLEYINDNKPTGDFMTMARYGPYEIDHAADVMEFSKIVLSFMI